MFLEATKPAPVRRTWSSLMPAPAALEDRRFARGKNTAQLIAGDVAARKSELAFIYAKGDGVPVNNDNEAFKWFSKAAEQGDAISQFNLGVMYAKGRSVEQDYTEAFKWYKKGG